MGKTKGAAAALAILLGTFGAHKFYLRRIKQGVFYLLFFWTGIPFLVGIVEGIVYLAMDAERFDAQYNPPLPATPRAASALAAPPMTRVSSVPMRPVISAPITPVVPPRPVQRLKSSAEFGLVTRFVENVDAAEWDSRISDLRDLLDRKGHSVTRLELLGLVFDEHHRNVRARLEMAIQHLRPSKAFHDYCAAFVQVAPDECAHLVPALEDILVERGLPTSPPSGESLGQYIDGIKRELQLREFESELLRGTRQSTASLDLMSGREFEQFLSRMFERMGYGVEQVGGRGDQGADLVLTRRNERLVVQAKKSSSPITNKAVQEVVGAMPIYRADRAMVVTTATFTPGAVELATANNVDLVDGRRLDEMRRRSS